MQSDVHNLKPIPRFSWRMYFKSTIPLLVILGLLEWFWHSSDGKWTIRSAVPAVLILLLQAFLGYRWDRLIKEQSTGKFSEEKYRNNPAEYILSFSPGKIKTALVIVAVMVIIGDVLFEFSRVKAINN